MVPRVLPQCHGTDLIRPDGRPTAEFRERLRGGAFGLGTTIDPRISRDLHATTSPSHTPRSNGARTDLILASESKRSMMSGLTGAIGTRHAATSGIEV